MDNRTLFILTGLVLLGMILLLALNLNNILTGETPNQTYLKHNDVRGMAVSRNQLLYTLNFQQQNRVIDFLNDSVQIDEIKSGQRQPANVQKIIVYQFQEKPDIELTSIAYVDQNLIFSAPQWQHNGYLMELSEGDLQKLLSQTYD